MAKRLSTKFYIILILVNGLISIPAMFSMGMFYEHSREVDQAILRLNSLKRNRSNVFQYIMLNCSELVHEYPEFGASPQVDLCEGYGLAVKLGKLAVLSSVLYNIYLFYILYDLSLLLVIIIGISFAFSVIATFVDDTWFLPLLESILILTGYFIIVGHLFRNFNDHTQKNHSDSRIR
ncbi:unnamed protein product [Rotaria socialis]|uniref:Uncharacterized protein n=1 Tax=Rotaria socialis TaxID=392032 RepID=A0A817QCQ7_9BILA|nr:unnamed protein product [Rotaria socialis]CAF4554628.1 unnamed protein product [Rotaria socialis]CAF4600365.1 unnamed protein product [Rotaria socialis]